MVPKSVQNRAWRGLEATWEPPLCRGDPKTSFLAILAPLGDLIWGPVLAHIGHRFLVFVWYVFWMTLLAIWGRFGPYFWGLFWDVLGSLFESLRKAWHARKHQYLRWFRHVGAFGTPTLLTTFRIILGCFLGTLFWESFRTTFWWFWISFGVPLETILDTFVIPFLGFQGLPESRAGPGWRVIRWYLGSY